MTAWRAIPSWPAYEASDDGLVRRIATGRVLHPRLGADGYVRVFLRRARQRRPVPVLRLVCEAWHGPQPTPDHRAALLKGDRSRPHADDVAWLTRSERWAARCRTGTAAGPSLSADEARQIVALRTPRGRRQGVVREIAAAYGISVSTVSEIWSGKKWVHVRSGPSDLEDAMVRLGICLT